MAKTNTKKVKSKKKTTKKKTSKKSSILVQDGLFIREVGNPSKQEYSISYGNLNVGIYKRSVLFKFISHTEDSKGRKPKFFGDLKGVLKIKHPNYNSKRLTEIVMRLRSGLRNKLRNLLTIKEHDSGEEDEEESVEKLPEPKDIKIILEYVDEFLRPDFERIICVATSPKNAQNPPWLAIVAPPSSHKSFLLKFLDHPSISMFIDDLTDNSLAPGKPSQDASEVVALFDDAIGKNFIINDMSSIFGQRGEKINKILGILTSAYGGSFSKYSPGTGNKRYKTEFIMIVAMTIASYKKHRKYMAKIGTRFLLLKCRNIDKEHRLKSISKDRLGEMRLNVCSLVNSVMKKPLPTIDENVDKKIFNFAKTTTLLRTLMFAETMDDIEGAHRLYQQLCWLIRNRARLHGREPTLEDLTFFKGMAFESVGWFHHIKKIHEGTEKSTNPDSYLNRMIKAGESIGVIQQSGNEYIFYDVEIENYGKMFLKKYLTEFMNYKNNG